MAKVLDDLDHMKEVMEERHDSVCGRVTDVNFDLKSLNTHVGQELRDVKTNQGEVFQMCSFNAEATTRFATKLDAIGDGIVAIHNQLESLRLPVSPLAQAPAF